MDKQRDSWWFQIISLAIRFPWITILIFGGITWLGLSSASQLTLRTNFSDLLPDDHPVVVQAQTLKQLVGGASFVVVAVETERLEPATRFLDDLSERAQDLKGIDYIDHRPPEDFFRRSGLLYLSYSDLTKFHDEISRRVEQEKLKRTGLYIDLEDNESAFDLKNYEEKYGFILRPNSFYQNPNGTLLVLLIKPTWQTTDVSRTKWLLNNINKRINELDPSSYDPQLSVRLTGPYVKAMNQQKRTRQDALRVSLLAFLGAILYLWFHFRNKRALLYIGAPLAVAVSLVFVFAYYFYGSLNVFSSIACAVVLGLAADYGIHLLAEYHRHRARGSSYILSLKETIRHLSAPFLVASTTTAAAFFALTLSRFKAFREFGSITGMGIICCVVVFLLLFPALVRVVERIRPKKMGKFQQDVDSAVQWETRLKRFLKPSSLLIMTLILLAPLLTLFWGRLYFDYNLNNIMGTQLTKELDRRVDGIFNHTINPEVALADSLEEAQALARAIRSVQKTNRSSDKGTTIKQVVSLADFVPDRQEEKMRLIQAIRNQLTPEIIKSLNEKDRRSYERLKKMLRPTPIALADVPESIQMKFRDREGKTGRMVFIFPNFDMQQGEKFMQFVSELRQTECRDCKKDYYISGETTVFYEIVKMLFREGKYVMFFALMAIFLVLGINYRSITPVLMVFLPLVMSLLAMFGWMGLFHVPFNIINLAAFPIVLGVITDYVVHFYQRTRAFPDQSAGSAHQIVFRPILGSALTSLIGFGSLLFADVGGIRSFGQVVCLGIIVGIVTTLFWFPAAINWRRQAQ